MNAVSFSIKRNFKCSTYFLLILINEFFFLNMSLNNEKSMECQYEDDDDFFTCQIIHEKRLNDFLVEPDFSLDDLEVDIEAEKKKLVKKKIKKAKTKTISHQKISCHFNM